METTQTKLQATTAELPVGSLQPSGFNPRSDFRAETLQELADSITAAGGILEPLVVRPRPLDEETLRLEAEYWARFGEVVDEERRRLREMVTRAIADSRGLAGLIPTYPDGCDATALPEVAAAYRAEGWRQGWGFELAPVPGAKGIGTLAQARIDPLPQGYTILAGERRWRAAQLAGLETVPCRIVDVDDTTALQIALLENLQREDITALDEAKAFRKLIDAGVRQTDLAKRLGRSDAAISNRLRLLGLPDAVQARIGSGELTAAHGVALARYAKASPKAAEVLAAAAVERKAPSKMLEGDLDYALQVELKQKKVAREFDFNGYQKLPASEECKFRCPHGAFVMGSPGLCLRPSCFDEKNKAYKAQLAISTQEKAAEAEAAGYVDTGQLKYGTWQRLTERNTPPACRVDCEHRKKVRDRYSGQENSVCLDVECHKRLTEEHEERQRELLQARREGLQRRAIEKLEDLVELDSLAWVLIASSVLREQRQQVIAWAAERAIAKRLKGRRAGPLGKEGSDVVHPLQDALNKAIADMLVAMEFVALPQRWATGLEVEIDETTGKPRAPFVPGVDRIWSVASEETRFGQFDPADLGQFLQVQEGFRKEIATVSRTPLHFIIPPTSDWPSGEALKSAEGAFLKKVRDRQVCWGNVWEDVMRFALRIAGRPDAVLSCQWEDPTPRNDLDRANVAVLKSQVGIPERQLWREWGYSEQEIERMMEERQAGDRELGERLLTTFARGGQQQE